MINQGPVVTFKAGADLEAKRRIKIKSGTLTDPCEVEYAGAGEDFIGVTEYAVKSGELVGVRLKYYGGTLEIECTVATAIARGDAIYGAANGMVSDTVSGSTLVTALEAGVSNAHIECLPL